MGTQDVRCGGTEVCRPPSWTLPPLQATSEDLTSMGLARQYDHAPLLRFLMLAIRFLILATAGFAEGRWFALRVPVKGKSNTG